MKTESENNCGRCNLHPPSLVREHYLAVLFSLGKLLVRRYYYARSDFISAHEYTVVNVNISACNFTESKIETSINRSQKSVGNQ